MVLVVTNSCRTELRSKAENKRIPWHRCGGVEEHNVLSLATLVLLDQNQAYYTYQYVIRFRHVCSTTRPGNRGSLYHVYLVTSCPSLT